MKAMERIEEIRARRERVFTRRRLNGKAQREKRKMEDIKVVAQGEHLIQKELMDMEAVRQDVDPMADEVVQKEKNAARVFGEEKLRLKKKRKMLVGGGVEEEMDLD